MDTSAASPAPPPKKPPFFINRNFALLWSGQSISNVGDFVFETTLVLWIATIIARGQSWAPLAVSGALAATAIPIFLIGPLAGVFVDRWDKRHLMLAMDASRAILVALLLPVALGTLPAAWQLGAIYAVVFLASICAQFFNPARFVFIGDVVEERYRARASGLGQTTQSLASIIGPPLAAPLLFVVGVQWALIVNALSFVVSLLAILAVHIPRSAGSVQAAPHGTFFQELGAGLRFFLGNQVLLTFLVTILLVSLGNGALNALGVFFVTENLHAPATLYGFMDAAVGAGAVVGAILASLFAQRLGEARTFWLGLIVTGITIVLLARMVSFPLGVACYALAGLVIAPINVVVGPLILHVTPRAFVGRVMAVINPVSALMAIVSVAVAGTLASTVLRGFHGAVLGLALGPIDTIFTGTGLLVIMGGIYAMVRLHGVSLAKAALSAASAVAGEGEAPSATEA